METIQQFTIFGLTLLEFYKFGVIISTIFYFVCSLVFAIYRWSLCFIDYINGNDLDRFEESFTWTGDYIFNTRDNYPVAVFFDMIVHSVYGFLASIVWVATVPVLTIIFIAKQMRKYRMEQKEIMRRLRNEY